MYSLLKMGFSNVMLVFRGVVSGGRTESKRGRMESKPLFLKEMPLCEAGKDVRNPGYLSETYGCF